MVLDAPAQIWEMKAKSCKDVHGSESWHFVRTESQSKWTNRSNEERRARAPLALDGGKYGAAYADGEHKAAVELRDLAKRPVKLAGKLDERWRDQRAARASQYRST